MNDPWLKDVAPSKALATVSELKKHLAVSRLKARRVLIEHARRVVLVGHWWPPLPNGSAFSQTVGPTAQAAGNATIAINRMSHGNH